MIMATGQLLICRRQRQGDIYIWILSWAPGLLGGFKHPNFE